MLNINSSQGIEMKNPKQIEDALKVEGAKVTLRC